MRRGQFNPGAGGHNPDEDAGMVFEEVPEKPTKKTEKGVEDLTYREDPVETMARNVIGLEQKVAEAKHNISKSKPGSVEIAQVLLAKAQYEQAAYNERQGRSKTGEADRLLQEWQAAQDRLENLRGEQAEAARQRASDSIDAHTAAQLRRHRSPSQ